MEKFALIVNVSILVLKFVNATAHANAIAHARMSASVRTIALLTIVSAHVIILVRAAIALIVMTGAVLANAVTVMDAQAIATIVYSSNNAARIEKEMAKMARTMEK